MLVDDLAAAMATIERLRCEIDRRQARCAQLRAGLLALHDDLDAANDPRAAWVTETLADASAPDYGMPMFAELEQMRAAFPRYAEFLARAAAEKGAENEANKIR